MSLESVRAWLAEHAPRPRLIGSRKAPLPSPPPPRLWGWSPAGSPRRWRCGGESVFLLVARGDARLDNSKTKALRRPPAHARAEETQALTATRVAESARSASPSRCPLSRRLRLGPSTSSTRPPARQHVGPVTPDGCSPSSARTGFIFAAYGGPCPLTSTPGRRNRRSLRHDAERLRLICSIRIRESAVIAPPSLISPKR